MSNLRYLDMSNNHFGGLIPHCFGNIPSYLKMIDLRNNRFQGIIPNVYGDCGRLEGLILKGNQLEGEFPCSLSKCQSLSVIDLGNNHLNGTFPGWSEDLPNLQVLVLKSNKFHGHIQPTSAVKFLFLNLQVLDLSHNRNLFEIESLDLSWNQLTREIPESLTSIKGLAVLRLSHNRLVGRIPDGTQFKTFDENSFEGSVGLCGYPLPKKFSEYTQKPQLQACEDQKEESGFKWEVVMLGYGCVTLLGLLLLDFSSSAIFLAVASFFFWQWELSSLAVGTSSDSGNSIT
nr:leucine-rich repeat-containing protein [Tanacetum cinerariifolium]